MRCLSVRSRLHTGRIRERWNGAGDDVAGLFEQRRQDLEWLIFQLDPDAVFPQFPRLPINFKNSEGDPIMLNSHFCPEV